MMVVLRAMLTYRSLKFDMYKNNILSGTINSAQSLISEQSTALKDFSEMIEMCQVTGETLPHMPQLGCTAGLSVAFAARMSVDSVRPSVYHIRELSSRYRNTLYAIQRYLVS